MYKTTRVPDEHGRAVIEETPVTARGVIQPVSGEDLDRLSEGDRGSQSITVWTDTPLSSGSEGEPPDEVEWRGTRYMTRRVQDWGDYGPGFSEAVCVARKMKERAS